MKGLLLKDIYTLTRQMGIILVMIVFFAVMGGSMSAFALVYSAMLPITALAYDERAKWDTLAAMMPYSALEIVFSKYMLGYIGIVFAAVISGGAEFVLASVKGGAFGGEELAGLLLTGCVALAMLAINLPFMFRFGVERGRIVFFIIIAVTVFIGMAGAGKLVEKLESMSASVGVVAGVALALAAALNAASVLASTAMYKRRSV